MQSSELFTPLYIEERDTFVLISVKVYSSLLVLSRIILLAHVNIEGCEFRICAEIKFIDIPAVHEHIAKFWVALKTQ